MTYDVVIHARVDSELTAETLERYLVIALIDPTTPIGENGPLIPDGTTPLLEVTDYIATTVDAEEVV